MQAPRRINWFTYLFAAIVLAGALAAWWIVRHRRPVGDLGGPAPPAGPPGQPGTAPGTAPRPRAPDVLRGQVPQGGAAPAMDPGAQAPARSRTVGVRPELSACAGDTTDPAVACAQGLACVMGACARRCADDGDCAGSSCIDTSEGSVCVPSCARAGCPQGKSCVDLVPGGRASACMRQVGEDCHKKPCLAAHDCVLETNLKSERASFRCLRRCDPAGASVCAANEICAPSGPSGYCRTRCEPGAAAPCTAEETCTEIDASRKIWACTGL